MTDQTDNTDKTENITIPEKTLFAALGAMFLASSLRSRSTLGTLVLGAAGAGMGYLALKGKQPLAPALKIEQTDTPGEVLIRDAVTINKPADGLYAIWRNLPNLPHLMSHLQSVEVLDEKHSKWTAKAPLGQAVSWEAELTADEPGRRIAWQSLPSSTIENSGEVQFQPAPGQRGTQITVNMTYKPPLGATGAVLARLFGEEPAQQLRDDLMRFKREQELGFAPTTNGQTSGRPDAGQKTKTGEESPKAEQDQHKAGNA